MAVHCPVDSVYGSQIKLGSVGYADDWYPEAQVYEVVEPTVLTAVALACGRDGTLPEGQ